MESRTDHNPSCWSCSLGTGGLEFDWTFAETPAKERVSLEKDVETDRETVGDEVRKERVDVEGDVKKRKK